MKKKWIIRSWTFHDLSAKCWVSHQHCPIGHCWVAKTGFLTEGKRFTPKPSLLHFSLPSQPRICNGRKEYTFFLLNLSNQAHQETTLPQPHRDPLHTAFLLGTPWTKYGQRRLSYMEESQFNYRLPYPTAGKNYLKMVPSVHMLENSRGSTEPRVILTMTVRVFVTAGWVGRTVVSWTTSYKAEETHKSKQTGGL